MVANFVRKKTCSHAIFTRFKTNNQKFETGFSRHWEQVLEFLMGFESRLRGLQYDISLNPVRSLFVVPDFLWKTKKKEEKTKTRTNTKFLPSFNSRNNKII